jgi:hypothetical protein
MKGDCHGVTLQKLRNHDFAGVHPWDAKAATKSQAATRQFNGRSEAQPNIARRRNMEGYVAGMNR